MKLTITLELEWPKDETRGNVANLDSLAEDVAFDAEQTIMNATGTWCVDGRVVSRVLEDQ